MTQTEETTKLDVLLVKPGMYPQKVQIGRELKDLQAAVGGYIEAVYPYEQPVALICNEEGKLNGSPLNRALRMEDGATYDIIAGDFLVVGLGDEDFTSLSPDLMEAFEQRFHQPDVFAQLGKRVLALPMPDEQVRTSDAPALAGNRHFFSRDAR